MAVKMHSITGSLHRRLHVQGIRNRWLRNSFLLVTVIMCAAAICLAIFFSSYYYTAMRTGLETKAKTVSDFFSTYATTESEYESMAAYYIADFDEKDSLELQFLTVSEGEESSVYLSSYGITAGSKPGTVDITEAVSTGRTATWSGRDPSTGERIMAVSVPISSNGEVKAVMRLVTSLRAMDNQLIMLNAIVILIGLFIVALTYALNMFFIRTVIEPMAGVTETAKRIASGYYGVQLKKEHDDEVGDLIDAVNDMSVRISQNEQMKSEFISSVSHELRTPLTAINGWGETLISGRMESAEDVKKGMQIIVSESRRLTKMVEELLEFSRIEDGRFHLNIEPIDLQAEFEDAIYTYRAYYSKEGITLNYDMPDVELPPLPGDPERLRQVFSNLFDNAAKHGGAGGRIDTAIGVEDGFAAIVIRDYGPGIPEDELLHVKEKFYKGSSRARGNGIGLAVCDEIIQRHGGRLDIANARSATGCVVTILLPFAPENAAPAEEIKALKTLENRTGV